MPGNFSGSGSSGERRFGGNRDGGRGGGFRSNFGPREMHKAVCSDCKKECEVPFKPTEGKPVYCRDCFQNHKKF
jgi:CxxC-x17-CxxC domain-containing protein